MKQKEGNKEMTKNWIESIAARVSNFNRTRKYSYFIKQLNPSAKAKLLDVGFANHEGVRNEMINYLEKHYPYPENITALGVNRKDEFEQHYPLVRAVIYDGREFPFMDKEFDIGWSNAVIEHVGDRDRQVLFVRELLRTCRVVYFTTPNRYFPIELHTKLPFLHWLPAACFDRIVRYLGMPWATNQYINLLSKREIRLISQEAGAKRISIKGNRFGGFVMDYSIILEM